jgi:nitrogen fixation protein FixH
MTHRGVGRPRKSRWPLMIFGLIGLNMGIVAVTIVAATSDPSVATEPEYYTKALRFDETIKQRQENARLGWMTSVSIDGSSTGEPRLRVTLVDQDGMVLRGAAVSVELFASVRAGSRRHVTLRAMNEGSLFEAPVAIDRGGAWIIRLKAQCGSETFTRETELLVPEASN